MALYSLVQSQRYEISCLLTTITQGYERISMHGVRKELYERQVQALGFPVEQIFIPMNSDNGEYEERMLATLSKYRKMGVEAVAFGDIFLEDLKNYRLANLAKIGMKGLFPLWERNTADLAREFIKDGFKALVTCVDTKALGEEFCGREFNEGFLSALPDAVDTCGENGEFHTFVYAGPLFLNSVGYVKGKIVLRENRFFYCDLLPAK